MADKNKLLTGKIFGILSIVFAFLSSWGIGGIVLGIIGLNQVKKEKKSSVKEIRKMNITGIVIGGIIFLLSVASFVYLLTQGAQGLSSSLNIA